MIPYEVDPENLAALHVAEQLGEDIERVFKTLVLRGDRNGVFVCVVPGDMEVDLKAAAKISGNKSAEMIAMKELLPTNRIYTRRLFSDRHEEAFSYLYTYDGPRFRFYLRQCRCAGEYK